MGCNKSQPSKDDIPKPPGKKSSTDTKATNEYHPEPTGNNTSRGTDQIISSVTAFQEDNRNLYKALYDYEKRTEDDLAFTKDTVLEVTDHSDVGWWYATNLSTQETGYIPSNYVSRVRSIFAEDWYFGAILRNTSFNILSEDGLGKGTFLVRDSVTVPGVYVISVRTSEAHEQPKVVNIRVHPTKTDTGGIQYHREEGRKFDTLQDLIAFYSADEITKKLSSLRSQYSRERSRLEASPKSGSSAEEVQNNIKAKAPWMHYESLHFLRDFIIPKSSRSNFPRHATVEFHEDQNEDTEQFTVEEIDQPAEGYVAEGTASQPVGAVNDQLNEDGVEEPDQVQISQQKSSTKRPLPKAHIGPKMSKRQKMENEESDLLKKAVSALEKASVGPSNPVKAMPADPDDLFGQYVTSELKSIKDEYMKKIIKHKIQNVIFETQISSMPPITGHIGSGMFSATSMYRPMNQPMPSQSQTSDYSLQGNSVSIPPSPFISNTSPPICNEHSTSSANLYAIL